MADKNIVERAVARLKRNVLGSEEQNAEAAAAQAARAQQQAAPAPAPQPAPAPAGAPGMKKGGSVHKHQMEHHKKHAAGFQHEQEKVAKHYGHKDHKMHHEHVKAMCGGGATGKKHK